MTPQALTFEQIVTHLVESLEVECSLHGNRNTAGAHLPLPFRTQMSLLDKEWDGRRKHDRLEIFDFDSELAS